MSVSQTLSATPGVVKAPVEAVDIFLLRDFLNNEDCGHLVKLIDAGRKPSPLFSPHPDPEFRTSETCNLDRTDGVVRAVESRISSLLGIPAGKGEYLQGQYYATGQQYKAHHDYLDTRQPYWQTQRDVGGQRTWTAMAFLKAATRGGETYFPTVHLVIPPREGSIVIWNNLTPDGQPNPATLHQGMPVIAGEKYIITKWFREHPWGPGISHG